MLLVSVGVQAAEQNMSAEPKKHSGWAAEDIEHLNDRVKERIGEAIEQLDERMGNRIDQAFDQVDLLRAMMKDNVHQIMHDETIDLAQNMTKVIIASSLGIGAVIGFYQAVKAAITLAATSNQEQDKQQYVTILSCAGVAALCASCSLLCYWSIN